MIDKTKALKAADRIDAALSDTIHQLANEKDTAAVAELCRQLDVIFDGRVLMADILSTLTESSTI